MTSYQWGEELYRSRDDLLDAMASQWVTGGGDTATAHVRQYLAEMDDASMAKECADGWELNRWDIDLDGEDIPSHMAEHGYDMEDLVEAISRFRERIAAQDAA